jgi:hypothetical protein
MPFTSGSVSQFPEKSRSSHKPDGEKPSYIKGSQGVGAGHTDHPDRMPHPFKQPVPNDESGEGQGN